MTATIGIDIGGTKIAAALVGPDGTAGRVRRVATPATEGPDAVLRAAITLARATAREAADAGAAPLACGVGTAGTVGEDGRISHATTSLPGWTGTDVRGALAAALGLPVVVRNDVQAMAVAESRLGAAAGARTALVVAAGTGIGGAVVADGMLLSGRTGFAGSVGHLPSPVTAGRPCGCGALDHVESYAAGPAIAAAYAARAGLAVVPPLETVAEAARGGAPEAEAAIAEAAHVLGAGLATAANLLDPDVVVLGGGVLGLGDGFVQAVAATLRRAALPGPAEVPLRITTFGPAAVLTGAALLAHELGRSAVRFIP
ncbi:ROK family protein [Dactylosporangium salmoneum]|uniref:ROK family protein n=1 Tax=Dactylosporangium salmoneum TaxID=53361 RepID=A0ABN3FRJ4_9ACTN